MLVSRRYPQGILVSCEIPWNTQEELHDDLFRREVEHFLGCGFRHLYPLGTRVKDTPSTRDASEKL